MELLTGTGELVSHAGDLLLDVAAQQVSFGPGLYVVTLSAEAEVQTGALPLPCVRLDPLPPGEGAPGTAHVSCLNAGNWLTGNGQPAFLRVTGGRAALMLTTYNPAGGRQPPQVRIRLVPDDATVAGAIGPANRPTPATSVAADDAPLLALVVHCSDEGSKTVAGGEWVQATAPDGFIEAFCIRMAADLPLTLEYQAIMGVDWVSPWAASPSLCGSVGLGLAIFGLRVRVAGPQAEAYELILWGRSGTSEVGPVTTGELAFGLEQPLTALKLELRLVWQEERRARPRRGRLRPQS